MRTDPNTMVMVAVGVAPLLTGTSCGAASGASSPSSGTSTTTPAPAAIQGPQALGTTITTSVGDAYTVLAEKPVQSKSQLNTPAPGGAFSAADIKECAGSGQTLTTNPTDWTLDLSGNYQAPGHDASLVATPGAALPTSATVNSGQCVEGWVAFTGFADGIAHEVLLNGTNFRWTVP
jgi:hypothetical protein